MCYQKLVLRGGFVLHCGCYSRAKVVFVLTGVFSIWDKHGRVHTGLRTTTLIFVRATAVCGICGEDGVGKIVLLSGKFHANEQNKGLRTWVVCTLGFNLMV